MRFVVLALGHQLRSNLQDAANRTVYTAQQVVTLASKVPPSVDAVAAHINADLRQLAGETRTRLTPFTTRFTQRAHHVHRRARALSRLAKRAARNRTLRKRAQA